MAKILLIEDDKTIADTLISVLTADYHNVEWVDSGTEGEARARLYQYDLIILDWGLPGMSGLEVCRTYRNSGGRLPILMLTAHDTIDDKELGLDTGADDYLTKPFGIRELKARVRALLRRPTEQFQSSSVVQAGNMTLNRATGELTVSGSRVELLRAEILLLDFFMQHYNQLFTADALLNRVWSSESDASPAAIRQCISRLRKKIDSAGSDCSISAVYGLGYKLEIKGDCQQ